MMTHDDAMMLDWYSHCWYVFLENNTGCLPPVHHDHGRLVSLLWITDALHKAAFDGTMEDHLVTCLHCGKNLSDMACTILTIHASAAHVYASSGPWPKGLQLPVVPAEIRYMWFLLGRTQQWCHVTLQEDWDVICSFDDEEQWTQGIPPSGVQIMDFFAKCVDTLQFLLPPEHWLLNWIDYRSLNSCAK